LNPLTALSDERVIIKGREEVYITKSIVTLSDIAEIEAKSEVSTESLVSLSQIKIMDSPRPGGSVELSGTHVLDLLKSKGVDFSRVIYSIPRTINLTRASRSITQAEVRNMIKNYLKDHSEGATLLRMVLPRTPEVFTGDVRMAIKEVRNAGAGRMQVPIEVVSVDGEKIEFTVDAYIARMKEVPVALRRLQRGEIVDTGDVVKVRLNIEKVPDDIILDVNDLKGYEVSMNVAKGQFFQKKFLKFPPLIETGSNVTIMYKKGLLEASATGIALDDGADGEMIRVRNETSRKIIKGRVVAQGLVEVGQ
jgi:flagella basal body P-ring formation protein FlgA